MQRNNEQLSVLLLVKERILTSALADLINNVAESVPYYNGLKAAYCVSANPTRALVRLDIFYSSQLLSISLFVLMLKLFF